MKRPEYHHHEEFVQRSAKRDEIFTIGIDPYPHTYRPTTTLRDVEERYSADHLIGTSEQAEAGDTPFLVLAGRLVLFRAMGKNAFAHIQDGTGRLQLMFNRDKTFVEGYPESASEGSLSPLKWIEKKIDLGDWLGVEGHLFRTHKGELTLFVKKATLLCKTLLPLADKHAGLEHKELRYRKRWLDLISNPKVAALFRTRSMLFQEIRRYFEEHGFLEVETPILQSIYGGAEARPFQTRLHALDQEMFLRISLEIPLKKLIVGGMEKVYEIGKVFRNEGIDRNHNPEFTLLEAYAAYWDYNDMMCFVERLFEQLALKLYGSTLVPYSPGEGQPEQFIDMKAPWKRLSMKESLKIYAMIDVDLLSEQEMRELLKRSEHCDSEKLPLLSRGLLIATLFSVYVEHHLIDPHHIYDHPIETTPLCKLHRDPKLREEGLVERFESFVLAQEVCNSYTELNDPVLQRELLEKQALRKETGDLEASPMDEEFLEAICQGMPPCAGVGIGLDRLVMILMNAHSIRDVLYFPWMKPIE